MSIIFRLFYQLFSKKVQSIIFTIIFWVKIGHVNYSINYFINYSAKKSSQLFSGLFHTSIIFSIFFDFFINYSEKSLSIIFTIIFLSKLDISIIFRFDFFSKNLDNRPTIVAERLIAQVQGDCDGIDYSAIVPVRSYSHPATRIRCFVTVSLFSHYNLFSNTVHGEGKDDIRQ